MNKARNNKTRKQTNRSNPNRTNTIKSEVGISVAAKNKAQRSTISPEFRMGKLRFQADYANITNSGVAYAGKMMYANNLYDPDPALLTSSVAGYADNMDFYFYCLPITSKSRVTLTNREAFPVKACLIYTVQQADLLFSSQQNVIDIGENPISTPWVELSAQGGQDRATLNLKVNLGRMNGSELDYNGNAATYSSQPTSGPPYPLFVSILLYAGSNFTSAGVGVSWTQEWTVRYWSRRLILDSGPTLAKKTLLRELEDLEFNVSKKRDTLAVLKTLEEVAERRDEDSRIGILEDQIGTSESDIRRIKLLLDNPYLTSNG